MQRGFVKLHLLVDANTKKILDVAVTDDRTGDSPVLRNLLGTDSEANSDADADADRPMAAICCSGGPALKQIPRISGPWPNTLADGISPLAGLLSDTVSYTEGTQLLADGAYTSREDMRYVPVWESHCSFHSGQTLRPEEGTHGETP